MKIKQVRYFGGSETYPNYIIGNQGNIINNFINGDWLGSYVSKNEIIKKVGIQTIPGTGVYINQNTTPIVVNGSGILEIEVKSGLQITSIGFDSKSINLIANNTKKENGVIELSSDFSYLIIDLLIADPSEENSDSDEDSSDTE